MWIRDVRQLSTLGVNVIFRQPNRAANTIAATQQNVRLPLLFDLNNNNNNEIMTIYRRHVHVMCLPGQLARAVNGELTTTTRHWVLLGEDRTRQIHCTHQISFPCQRIIKILFASQWHFDFHAFVVLCDMSMSPLKRVLRLLLLPIEWIWLWWWRWSPVLR